MEPFFIIAYAMIITVIGALPFGLVNLSVLDISNRKGTGPAMQLSHGAAVIEVLFGLTALTAGGLIANYLDTNPVINYLILSVPAVAGIVFLSRGRKKQETIHVEKSGFLRGMILNLVSIQVLLYWLLAMTYLQALLDIRYTAFSLILFALGVWLGKIGVLWLYAIFSSKVFGRLGFFSRNINRIIGVVLLFTVVLQLFKL